MLPNDTVILAHAGPVARLTLNRPAALNTLDFAMVDALVAASDALARDNAIRVVVLAGAGKHFMAGGDVRTFHGTLSRPAAERHALLENVVDRIHYAIETFHRLDVPVVARVQGAVAGFGLSMVCACDLAIAADDAYFAAAYRQIGLSPDGGMSWSLPRLVGARRAAEILLLSERFDAQEALAMGLVNRVVPVAELDAAVDKVVASIVAGPRGALKRTKRLLRQSTMSTLSDQLRAEAVSFASCATTDEFAEGVSAFVEKRHARFGG
jgi:2-(1,2-epoxy-1,2-dihydrophenyl)acetyl-CoA isomerase